MHKITSILILLIVNFSFSQELKVNYLNGETKNITGKLIENENHIISTIKTKNNEYISLSNIQSISTKNKIYIVKNYENEYVAFEEIIKGNLTLYKSKNQYFLESKEYNFRKIPYKTDGDYTFTTFDAGILGVFINKCKAAQKYLENNFNILNESKLKKTVTIYNSCTLSENIVISDEAIKESLQPKDKISFGINVGNTFLTANFKPIDLNYKEHYSLFNFGAFMRVNPNFLNRKVFFNLKLAYLLNSKKKTNLNNTTVKSKFAFIESTIDANYTFLKQDSKFNPYFGFGFGFYFNNKSYVYKFNQIETIYSLNSQLIYTLNTGLLIRISKNYLDVNISYLPKTKFNLKTQTLGNNFAYLNVQGIHLKLLYNF